MPIYTYACTACNDVIERRQSFADAPLTTCEQCGGSLRKVIHPVGIVFKGSGWYVTDSRATSNGSSAPKNGESKETGGEKAEKNEPSGATAAKSESGSTSSDSSSSKSEAPSPAAAPV